MLCTSRRFVFHGRHGPSTKKSTTRLFSATNKTASTPKQAVSLRTVAIVSVSLATGYSFGRASSSPPPPQSRMLPSGLPRTCCDDGTSTKSITPEQEELIHHMQDLMGKDNVLCNSSDKRAFEKGMRLGQGEALCVVTPRTLEELVKSIPYIVNAKCTILVQGANTGLTGGSVPRSSHCGDRPTVILSTRYLDTIVPIDDGNRVLCLAGAGLASLTRFLETHFPHRESHSTLGSTFLNPTMSAGVALGSGGTQCRKGSAYTDRALYLKVYRDKWGDLKVDVVNTLGIAGIEDSDFYTEGRSSNGNVVQQLDHYCRDVRQGYQRSMAKSSSSEFGKANASDVGYSERLCECDNSVSRCNADTRGSDCNRSEGKVIILATVHDTFPKPLSQKSFWLSFDSLETALAFRRQVCLDNPKDIPISLEYMDRDSFDVIDRSGRVLAGVIKAVGPTSSMVKGLWSFKQWIEGLPFPSAPFVCDKVLYSINNWVPAPLPTPIMKMGKATDHHIAMTVGEYGDGSMKHLLNRLEMFARTKGRDKIDIYECKSPSEANSLTAFRFVAAPAFKTWCIGNDVQGFSVDYALPKNGGTAPPLSSVPVKRMRYSHFACNVVHEDLAYPLDVDAMQAKLNLKKTVEHSFDGKLPAEHGHGTEYIAPPDTQDRWKRIDPLNVMNPGIGGLSMAPEYKEDKPARVSDA